MITIGKEGSSADLTVPEGVLDFSVENRRFQEQVDATLVGDDTPELDEPDEFSVDRTEYSQSADGKYCVCALRKHNAVVLFEAGEFRFKKDVVDPGTPIVTDAGAVIVPGYTEGGYQEGKHFLYVWDDAGTTVFETEFQATVNLLRVSRDARFIACQTAEVLLQNQPDYSGPSDRYDYSIHIIDVESDAVRARYTDQMPGISTGGPNIQIRDIRFVYSDSDPLIALFAVKEPSVPATDSLTPADLPAGTPLIDMDANLVEFGQPNLDPYPDHYALTREGKKRLDEN